MLDCSDVGDLSEVVGHAKVAERDLWIVLDSALRRLMAASRTSMLLHTLTLEVDQVS
jgi:hypothetical protein